MLLRTRRPGLPARFQEAWARVKSASRPIGAVEDGTAAAAASGHASGHAHGSRSLAKSDSPERVARVLAHSFHRAPRDTAAALLRELNELDRIQLVLALKGTLRDRYQELTETQYVEDISKQISLSGNQQHRKLTRQQIQDAVRFQRQLGRQGGVEQPASRRQLLAVGVASGLPFIAFGFLDNGIMLVAGEQIDAVFGAKLGLTMMASAGLGNMVADVVGVSATHSVQEAIKRLNLGRPPRLSLLQQQQPAVKAATVIGAALGVAVGCLLGMSPLLFMEPGFFVSGAQAAADAAAALGGAGEATDAAAAALGVTTVGVPAAAADQAGGEPLPAGETAAAAAAATVTAATGAAPEAASPVDSLAAGKPAAAPHGATVPTTKLA